MGNVSIRRYLKMSDKPPKDENVVKHPQNDMSVQRLGLLTTQQRQEAHKNLTEGLDKAYSEIDKNQQLVGAVIMTFDDGGEMTDWAIGEVGATNLYMMLDKMKMEILNIITENQNGSDG